MLPGEEGLTQAFDDFMIQTESGQLDAEATSQGLFSYILTKRQRSEIKKVCNENQWVDPEEKGITLTKDYFEHVLNQRKVKDKVTARDCSTILASAYSKKSKVAINKPRFKGDRERDQQALIFNAEESIRVGNSNGLYGVAIIEISIKNLSPVTAYHATRPKVTAFGR